MRVRDEQLIDEIFVFDLRRRATPATPTLGLVNIDGLRFRVAAMRQRDDNLCLRNQVLILQVAVINIDLSTPLVAISVTDFNQLLADYAKQFIGVSKNSRKFFNFI